MRRFTFIVTVLLCGLMLTGCQRGRGGYGGPSMIMSIEQMQQSELRQDREAILKMAGTFKVSFDFEETLPLRKGYELAKPYHTEAEELVVVVENSERFVSLQHLLVVRHEGETHVINHWRQDWVWRPARTFSYVGDATYRFKDRKWDKTPLGTWVQEVYNVADSPRYASSGQWLHRAGYSQWTSNELWRPLPLREASHREDYNILRGTHTITVNDFGWTHEQDNVKDSMGQNKATVDTVVALERGMNQYLRIPDENFEKAHDYWRNTAPYWKEVRKVWAEVFASRDSLKLADKWKGDALFTHLNGLGDSYWGQADAGAARPKIKEIIDAFIAGDHTE